MTGNNGDHTLNIFIIRRDQKCQITAPGAAKTGYMQKLTFGLKLRNSFLQIQINQQIILEHDNFEFMKTGDGKLQDFPINVKFKLSALWASVMFCYVYGDFFSLFLPSRLQNLLNGESGVGATTPLKLLMFAVLMTLPSLMVFLSLALKAKTNRRLNIALGIFWLKVSKGEHKCN